jgi:predicted amidohydrolase YtcJ
LFFSSTLFLHGQTRQHADLMITGGMVVTMDGQRSVHDDGAVVVTGDTILAIGPRAPQLGRD